MQALRVNAPTASSLLASDDYDLVAALEHGYGYKLCRCEMGDERCGCKMCRWCGHQMYRWCGYHNGWCGYKMCRCNMGEGWCG